MLILFDEPGLDLPALFRQGSIPVVAMRRKKDYGSGLIRVPHIERGMLHDEATEQFGDPIGHVLNVVNYCLHGKFPSLLPPASPCLGSKCLTRSPAANNSW